MPLSDIKIGHWDDPDSATGCTVVICPPGTIGSGLILGGATGTREASMFSQFHLVQEVSAVLLTGGSAFGLAAADGVMSWLEEHGRGYLSPGGHVPIVPAAVLYDLEIGNPLVRPDKDCGYAACENALPIDDNGGWPARGSVGAGCGATVGKLYGPSGWMKGGIGWARRTISTAPGSPTGPATSSSSNPVTIAALAAVNAFGDVLNEDGTVLAGCRRKDGEFGVAATAIADHGSPVRPDIRRSSTTLAVLMTDAKITKKDAGWMARLAQNGLSRAIDPVQTIWDGDTIFSMATGTSGIEVDSQRLGIVASSLLATAIRDAVISATSIAGAPSLSEHRTPGGTS